MCVNKYIYFSFCLCVIQKYPELPCSYHSPPYFFAPRTSNVALEVCTYQLVSDCIADKSMILFHSAVPTLRNSIVKLSHSRTHQIRWRINLPLSHWFWDIVYKWNDSLKNLIFQSINPWRTFSSKPDNSNTKVAHILKSIAAQLLQFG